LKKIIVFFGKGGSNFLNILKHQTNYKVILGITNREDSTALKEKNLPPILISNDHKEIFEKLKPTFRTYFFNLIFRAKIA
jgi:phosphoribosylglycinamide formyltransferase-1